MLVTGQRLVMGGARYVPGVRTKVWNTFEIYSAMLDGSFIALLRVTIRTTDNNLYRELPRYLVECTNINRSIDCPSPRVQSRCTTHPGRANRRPITIPSLESYVQRNGRDVTRNTEKRLPKPTQPHQTKPKFVHRTSFASENGLSTRGGGGRQEGLELRWFSVGVSSGMVGSWKGPGEGGASVIWTEGILTPVE